MRSKTASLHPLLILLAVALVSVLFVVSCGGGATATAVPASGAAEAAATEAAELAAAAEAAAAEAAELAAAAEAAGEAEAAEAAAEAAEAAAEAAEAAAEAAEAAEAAAAQAAAEAAAAEVAELPGAPKYGGTLIFATYANHITLDPPFAGVSPTDTAITQAAYDNLLMIQPDLTVKPELATSWEANADLSSYTFYLRKGVKFHHGKEFKAEDVVSTFMRLLDPVLDSPTRTQLEVIQDMVILDDYTVRFDLDGPNGFFLDALSTRYARIVPSDVDVERLTLEEFGTGPFMIEDHLPGERTVMVRNPDYWEEGRPYLDELVIRYIPEVAIRAESLKSGDIDVVYALETQSVAGLEAHPDTVVLKTASFGWIGMPMRTDTPPFDNILVRKAMQAAMDRESINQAALLGLGDIAYEHVIPRDDSRHAFQYRPPEYDPDLARSLLEQAGYPDGIDVTLHTADVGPGMIGMAVAFKESAAPAGIRVNLERRTEDGFWSEVWGVEAFTVVYWAGRANPDQAMSIQNMSGVPWNKPRHSNPVLDELIIRARGETLEEQIVTYAEVQRILIDEVPRLIPVFQPWLYGARANVRGASPHPLFWPILNDAWIDD